jgi:ubiquitin C-terminal hydrolase|uniref:USP domain-containing protein n=1 Tax=viral metagenome TaxID=1070528 RepID=A0A6C0IUP2_9ZZZZ
MKGFNNIGNTCYLNAGLQMLVHNRDFCNLIISLSSKSNILDKIATFIKEYHNGTGGVITPSIVKTLAADRNSMFSGSQQQDSSEFIIFFLDYLNIEINKVLPDNRNVLDKIFEIHMTTSTKCKVLSCLTVSNVIEKPTLLMLDVNGECTSLDECYALTKQKVKLDGDEKYFCEKCDKKRIASQRKEITHWPNNLIVWLRRFQQNGRRLSKYSQEIMIPISWKQNYKLTGIVYHMGNLFGGHYVYAGIVNNKWYLFNDASVSELGLNELAKIVNNGYIYYYAKE